MDLKQMFSALDRIDRLFDRMLVLAAFIFGTWLTWSFLNDAGVSFFMQIGGALTGGLVTATIVWVIWFIANLLN